MTHPHLPITHADLKRIVAELWPDVARLARVPSSLGVTVQSDGRLVIGFRPDRLTALPGALARLLDAMELRYLAVDREAGRVLGWAAWTPSPRLRPVRLTYLDRDDPARLAWDARVHAGIQERMVKEDGDAPRGKLAMAREQGLSKSRRTR